jgi:hypothetical protein
MRTALRRTSGARNFGEGFIKNLTVSISHQF